MARILTFNIDKDRRNLINDETNVDLSNTSGFQIVQGRQYENESRQVEVHCVYDDGTPANLAGANPVLEGLMPDGTHRIVDSKHGVDIDMAKGIFRFDLPAPVFAIAGSYKQAFFRLYKDGNNIATLEFTLEVLTDQVITGIVPTDYITPFMDLYDKLDAIFENADDEFKAQIEKWRKQVNDLITKANVDLDNILKSIDSIQTLLNSIQDQINGMELVTKEDLQNAITDVTNKIENELNSYIKIAEADNKYLGQNVGIITADTDWNTITKNGVYSVSGAKGANCPTGTTTTWGDLIVLNNNEKWSEQHYYSATTNGTEFVRSFSGTPGKWSDWQPLVTKGELDSATQELQDGLKNWISISLINGLTGSSDVAFCVVGDLVIFRGWVKLPTNYNGSALTGTTGFTLPLDVAHGQYLMQSATQANGGSSTKDFVDIFPNNSREIKFWHGTAEKSYSLNGIIFTLESQ